MRRTSAFEELFHCPNPQCKRSKGRSPFKRLGGLKRHLESCKHRQDASVSPEISTSASASGSPDGLNCPAGPSIEVAKPKSKTKRPRLEDEDDESGDEQLVRNMIKKYKSMSKEVDEKEREYRRALDDLERLAAAIQVLRKKNKEDA